MKSDLFRLSKSSAFYVSPIIILLFILIEANATGLNRVITGASSNNCVEFFNMTIYYSPLTLLIPFLGAIPFAAAYCEDVNSKYLIYVISRNGSAKRYTLIKLLSVWGSGFLVTFLPVILFVVVCVVYAKPFEPHNFIQLEGSVWFVFAPYAKGAFVITMQTLFLGCFSASCAVMALAASAYFPNPFFTWCFPLVFCYGANFLFEKLAIGILNPIFSYSPPTNGSFAFTLGFSGMIYMAVYHVVVALICVTLFYFGVQRSLSGGSFRFNLHTIEKMEMEH